MRCMGCQKLSMGCPGPDRGPIAPLGLRRPSRFTHEVAHAPARSTPRCRAAPPGARNIPSPQNSPAPELLLHLRGLRKHFPRAHSLHGRDAARRTAGRHRLDWKVSMLPIQSNLQKSHLPPLLGLQTRPPQQLIDMLPHHHPPIHRGAYQVLLQHRYMVALVDIPTLHPATSPPSKPKQASGYRTHRE